MLFDTQAAELADTEFAAGVPALLRKIVEKRPRVLCFVGKAIWESFIREAAPSSKSAVKTEVLDVEFTMNVPTGTTRPTPSSSTSTPGSSSRSSSTPTTRAPSRAKAKRTNSKKPKPEPFVFDLQPYKVVHSARM